MTFVIVVIQMLLIFGRRNAIDRLETFGKISRRGKACLVSHLADRIFFLFKQLGRLVQTVVT